MPIRFHVLHSVFSHPHATVPHFQIPISCSAHFCTVMPLLLPPKVEQRPKDDAIKKAGVTG